MRRSSIMQALRVGALIAVLTSGSSVSAQILLPELTATRARGAAEGEFESGIAALRQGNLAAAEAAFQASLKLDANAAGPHMGLAEVALKRGNQSLAQKHLQQAVALAPQSADVQTTWGAFLYAARALPESEVALRKAVTLDPKAVAAHVHLGDMYLSAFGKPDEAAREYRAAIAISPDHPGAHYALALALLSKNDLAQAELELVVARKLVPENPLPHHVLGKIYLRQQQFDKALTSFEAAIKAASRFAAPHLERGHIFLARGDDTAAIREYGEVQKKDPKRAVGYVNIGMVHQQKQRWADAEAAYVAATKVDPNNPVPYNNLAWMAAERNVNLQQALAWAQKAVAVSPKVPEFQGTLGWVYRARGDLARAEETLRAASALKPQRPAIIYNLGRVYLERGKKAEAATELKRALALQPDFAGADDARRLLKQLGQV
jgi:Tfp pilus assembly protein PilF